MKTDKVINLNKYRQQQSVNSKLPGKKETRTHSPTIICLQTVKVQRRLV